MEMNENITTVVFCGHITVFSVANQVGGIYNV